MNVLDTYQPTILRGHDPYNNSVVYYVDTATGGHSRQCLAATRYYSDEKLEWALSDANYNFPEFKYQAVKVNIIVQEM